MDECKPLIHGLDGLNSEELVTPMGLLSQLVLRSPAYAQQFLEGGGLDEALTSRLLAPTNPPPVLVDALLAGAYTRSRFSPT